MEIKITKIDKRYEISGEGFKFDSLSDFMRFLEIEGHLILK